MRRRGLQIWIWPSLLLAAAAGGYGVYWKIVHDQTLALLDAQAEAMRAEGYAVSWSRRTSGGFPLSVEVGLDEPSIGGPAGEDHGPWSWSADKLRVSLRPWSWNTVTLAPEGKLSGLLDGAELDGLAEGLTLTIDADAAGLRRATLASGPAALVERSQQVTLFRADAVAADVDRAADDPTAYRLVADLTHPEWAEAGAAAPASARVDAAATRLDSLRGQTDAAALAAWAAAGGTLQIRDAAVAWDDATVGARGDLRLDRTGRWNGQAVLSSSDLAATLGRLADLGALDPDFAAQARVIAASGRGSGEGAALELPLSVRRGEVYALGLFKLGEIAPAF